MDPLSIARYGMISAQNRLAQSADRVAGWSGREDVDLAQEAVEQITAKTQFAACAKAAGFADEMWRSLMALQAR